MSLVGRLDDLSLADIIQIVHLSRRTGTLEIVDAEGLHALLFCHGLIVNGSSPKDPDLVAYLSSRNLIPAVASDSVARLKESHIPAGDALIEMNAITTEALAGAVRYRILTIVQPLLHSRDGEFTFRLNESLTPFEIGFEPRHLFKEGGLNPQKVLGGSDKEKLKPLRGLEDSLKAGKALMTSPAAPPSLPGSLVAAPLATPAQREPFTQAGKAEEESDEPPSVVVFERNATMRVAIKRGFKREHVRVAQFGSLDDTRALINELLAAKRFFVTVAERTKDGAADRLLQFIKRRNPRLPVVLLEDESGMSSVEADRRVRKPGISTLTPADHARELAVFADDVVLSAQYALTEFTRTAHGDTAAAKRFYERGDADNLARRCGAVRKLISGLADPNDVGQVATTVLRLLEEYVDRGALFISGREDFIGIGGFGANAAGDDVSRRIAATKISRAMPSILSDVASSLAPHHGKLRRTAGNVQLMQALGGTLPTEVVALPIVHQGKTLGVVYGDNAHHCAPIDSTSAVEVFLFHAADAFANALSGPERVGLSS